MSEKFAIYPFKQTCFKFNTSGSAYGFVKFCKEKLAAACEDGVIRIYDRTVRTPTTTNTPQTHAYNLHLELKTGFSSISDFDLNDRVIIGAGERINHVKVWSLETGRVICCLRSLQMDVMISCVRIFGNMICCGIGVLETDLKQKAIILKQLNVGAEDGVTNSFTRAALVSAKSVMIGCNEGGRRSSVVSIEMIEGDTLVFLTGDSVLEFWKVEGDGYGLMKNLDYCAYWVK